MGCGCGCAMGLCRGAGLLTHPAGGLSFRLDSLRDGHHAWPLGQTWPGLEGEVDAAFAWDGRTYLIQVWPRRDALPPFPSPVGPARIPGSLPHWQDPPSGLCLRWGSSGTLILAPRLAGGHHPWDQGISKSHPPPSPCPGAAWRRGGTAYGSGPQDCAALAPSAPVGLHLQAQSPQAPSKTCPQACPSLQAAPWPCLSLPISSYPVPA